MISSTPSTLNGSNLTKRARFNARRRDLLSGCTWLYFPTRDMFQEIVTVQRAEFSPTGKSRILSTPLAVYGREVYEADETLWQRFLQGHPMAILALHAQFHEEPQGGGIFAPDAFAVQGAGGDAIR